MDMDGEGLKNIDYYIEIGAIEIAGVDESGEILFKITEKTKEIAPELWSAHSDFVNNMLVDLLEKDLISVEYNENLEASISISEEGEYLLKEMGMFPEE